MMIPLLFGLIQLLWALAEAVDPQNTTVDLSVHGNWLQTPFKLNVLESVSSRNQSLYGPLVEKLIGLQIDEDEVELDETELSDQAYYDYALSLLPTEPRRLAAISIANRFDSPRIEAQYKHYREAVEPKEYCQGDRSFIIQGLDVYCEPSDVFALKTDTKPELLLPTDHLVGDDESTFFVLYGDLESVEFKQTFQLLYQSMLSGKLSFTWRYIPAEGVTAKELVGGYGTDLTLKRTDYIVIDDRGFSEEQQKKMKFEATEEEVYEKGSIDLNEYHTDVKKLKEADLEQLDLKLTQHILDQPDSFEMLKTIVQDLPKYAASLAGLEFDKEQLNRLALKSLQDSQIDIPDGLYINNVVVPPVKSDTFEILRVFERELGYIDRLQEIGMNATESNEVLSAFAQYGYNFARMPYRRYDYSECEDAIVYFNDVENDRQYAELLPAREAYLEEIQMGQIPPARENIYEAVFVVDLADPVSLYYALLMTNQVLSKKVPQRVGILPLLNSTPNGRVAALQFVSIAETSGTNAALMFLHRLNQFMSSEEPVTEDVINDLAGGNVDEDAIEEPVSAMKEFVAKFSLDSTRSRVIIDGVILPLDENFRLTVQQLSMDVYEVYMAYQNGRIPDGISFRDYLRIGSLKQRVPYLVPDDMRSKQMNVVTTPSLENFSLLNNATPGILTIFQGQCTADRCKKTLSGKTLTLIGSFTSQKFRDQVVTVLTYAQESNRIKIRIIDYDNTEEFNALDNSDIDTLIQGVQAITSATATDADSIKQLVTSVFGITDCSSHLALGGRTIDLETHDLVTVDELDLLVNFELSFRLGILSQIAKTIDAAKETSHEMFNDKYDWYEYFSWLVSDTYFHREDEFDYNTLPRYSTEMLNDDLCLSVPSKVYAKMFVTLVIDPATEIAQKYLSMLSLFSDMEFVDLKVYLRPASKLEVLDIKRLYRGVYLPSPLFNADGSYNSSDLLVRYERVPEKTLFTTNIDDPQSWITTISEANADLDNVKLDLSGAIVGTYELENILVEGYARDTAGGGRRPIALPVELLDSQGRVYSDTSIMANFGYLQLKANPGSWMFEIKPGTKGESLYTLMGVDDIKAVENGSRLEATDKVELNILSLSGPIIYPSFKKKPGKENEFLVEGPEEQKPASLLSRFQDILKPKSKKTQADINIFSVASGHLYERLLEIMEASVMAHTKHSVKFWLIENYMSPQLKRDLPALSEHYGFTYQLLTYKWPTWLRHQREKQRIIWGYKILFLDVLFPQDLDKIIYVDSDQIVRTDMQDLVDHDLEGCVYGFTPMCDSREEMEGFRFWKQGYWKKLLGDKHKYHISALYVVDLDRFRKMAAGDLLRHHYQKLSSDPASLSNLDQDLPNNLQDAIPIHSLPQEWLWCETWCSDETLKDARTIDLCNNPLTKEPKLDRARRQIPEWTDYDNEIAQVVQEAKLGARENAKHDEL